MEYGSTMDQPWYQSALIKHQLVDQPLLLWSWSSPKVCSLRSRCGVPNQGRSIDSWTSARRKSQRQDLCVPQAVGISKNGWGWVGIASGRGVIASDTMGTSLANFISLRIVFFPSCFGRLQCCQWINLLVDSVMMLV